jgi:hypothetical protein
VSSGAWNIDDIELEDAPIFDALWEAYGPYVMTAPKVGFDD